MDGHCRRLIIVKAVGKTVTRLDELIDTACKGPKEILSGAVKDGVSNILDIVLSHLRLGDLGRE